MKLHVTVDRSATYQTKVLVGVVISIGAPSQTGVYFTALFPIGARAYYPESTVFQLIGKYV